MCFERCAGEDLHYFVLTDGNICFCGVSTFIVAAIEGTCEVPCSGDETLTCGGEGEDYDLYDVPQG